jgi:hypothetical protein
VMNKMEELESGCFERGGDQVDGHLYLWHGLA